MTNYNNSMNKRSAPRPEPHPIWRGIGCVINVIIPVISFAAAYMLIETGAQLGWPIPYQLMGHPAIHPLLWKISALVPLWGFIQQQNNLYAVLTLALLFTVILEAITSMFYAVMYRSAIPRYGPLDVPPPNVKVKRYKR